MSEIERTQVAMFSDLLALKIQLFHSAWPAADIVPYSTYATANDYSSNNSFRGQSAQYSASCSHYSVCQTLPWTNLFDDSRCTSDDCRCKEEALFPIFVSLRDCCRRNGTMEPISAVQPRPAGPRAQTASHLALCVLPSFCSICPPRTLFAVWALFAKLACLKLPR